MSSEKRNKITFIIPYPLGIAPGQRFRFEHYLDLLKESGFDYQVFPFYDEPMHAILYREGHIFQKIIGLARCFLKRIRHVWKARKSDFVYIFREAAPVGPPVFEWILCKPFKKKVIYDFDDAIWLPDPNESWIIRFLKYKKKVKYICRWSHKVTTGNRYLNEFASEYNSRAEVIPTVVNTETVHNPEFGEKSDELTIGWTGSHSTLIYLDAVRPVLQKLAKTYDFRFRVIADTPPKWNEPFLEFIAWDSSQEIKDLSKIDIGIMPLDDTEWSKGKCGFKLIQYMAIAIPAVASPVGVNSEIIKDGWNGFLCTDPTSWYKTLEKLINNDRLRTQLGEQGRKTIQENFSVTVTWRSFLNLFSS